MSSIGTFSISLNDYLNQYLSYLREPVTRLSSQRSQLEVKYGVFNDLDARLSNLVDILESFTSTGTSSVFRSKTVASSQENIITATATAGAAQGSHSIFVTQLAKAHTVVSDRYGREGTSISQSHSGTKTFSITVNGETYDASIEISAGQTDATVLANVASAINEATDGQVSASRMGDTPSTCKLSLRSGSTGSAGEMAFTDTDGLLTGLGVTNATQATDTVGGYVYADLGSNELDALLTVNGVNVISSDNVVDDVIEGLAITLLGKQEMGDTPVSLSVATDVENITSKIQEFLDIYNEAYAYVAAKTQVDGTTYERGLLAGDFPYVSLRSNMRLAMSSYVTGLSDYSALSQIGIESSRSGHFTIADPSLLEEAIAADPQVLEAIFASESGIGVRLESLLSGYTAPDGTISSGKEAIHSRIHVIEERIERQEALISLKEKDLRRQYAALQEVLYSLQMTESLTTRFSTLVGV
jgi:flagellar hook-associated protein 2